jgi:O-antigen ligase/polysaccharide polymerase Wzy-like membrane protein
VSFFHRTCDRIIHAGLVGLIACTPLAFGTVEPWSIALMEWGIVTLALVFLLSRLYPGREDRRPSPQAEYPRLFELAIPITLFVVLCILQTVPLPIRWLSAVSPGSARMYASVDFGSWERTEEKTERVRAERDDSLLRLRSPERRPVSVNPARTRGRATLLFTLVVLFFMVANWADEDKAVSILRSVTVVAFLVSMFGIVQLLTWNGKIYWVRKVPSAGGGTPSTFGPFVNHDHFAGYVEMTIPLALGLVFWLVDRRRRPAESGSSSSTGSGLAASILEGFRDERGWFGKLSLALFVAVILIVSLFFSLSRGGILAAFISGTVLLVLLCRRAASRALRWSIALALPAVVVALIAFIGAEAVKKQLGTYGNLAEESSFRLRLILWQRIAEELPNYVWLGTGLGTFEDSFSPLTPAGSAKRWDKAHNDYLQLLWETGVVGGVLFLSGVAIFIRRIWWPALRDFGAPIDIFRVAIAVGLMSIALHSAVDFCLQIGANGFLCALLAGLLVALRGPSGRIAPAQTRARTIEGPWVE